jgi:hypothetical protein
MSRIEVPLAYRTLQSTGDVVVRAELRLQLKTDKGKWETTLFVVASGTEMTTMWAADARDQDLPIPKRPVPALTFQGHEVRSGLLQSRIVAMDATEYQFPCYFLADPSGPVPRSRNLLGLTGVVNQIRLSFDGTPTLVAPFGVLVVEKK